VIRVTGNLAGLKAFERKVAGLASADARRAVLENVAEEAIDLIREGFSKESDPYGTRWAPLKYRSGRILQDTGRLRNSWHRRSLSASRVVIGTAVTYAAYHQSGTRRMRQRAMVPFRGMPAPWRRQLIATAELAWKSSVGFR
jgi:phage gpG-like protein